MTNNAAWANAVVITLHLRDLFWCVWIWMRVFVMMMMQLLSGSKTGVADLHDTDDSPQFFSFIVSFPLSSFTIESMKTRRQLEVCGSCGNLRPSSALDVNNRALRANRPASATTCAHIHMRLGKHEKMRFGLCVCVSVNWNVVHLQMIDPGKPQHATFLHACSHGCFRSLHADLCAFLCVCQRLPCWC